MKVITFFNSESQLIRKAAQENREAQRRLYELHAPKMLSVCRQYISDLYQAEEAMSNGFLKVFKNLRHFRQEGSFEGWIRRIMVNESLSYLRKNQKIKFSDYDDSVEAPVVSLQHSTTEVEHIQTMIDSLPEGYRVVFVLYAVEGYKHAEIAEMLDITEGTSKSQLFKARKMLQEKWYQSNTYQYETGKI